MPRSPDGLIPKQCVASHQDLRPHSSQSEDSSDGDDAGDSDNDGDSDDDSNFNDGNVDCNCYGDDKEDSNLSLEEVHSLICTLDL